MSISTYSELKIAIENWLDDDTIPDRVDEFIALAESRIARELRVRAMLTRDSTSIVLVAGQEYYTLPTDFLEARNIKILSNPITRLSYRTPEQMDLEFPLSGSAPASTYTIVGNELRLRPIPIATDELELLYFARFDALGPLNETNWLTTNAPEMLLYGALIEASVYLVEDNRAPGFISLFNESVSTWNSTDERARHSGSVVIMRTNTGNP